MGGVGRRRIVRGGHRRKGEAVNKVTSLDQLAELVPDGSTVGLGGAWLSNHPMAAVRQLVRDGVRDLHVAETMGSVDIDLLVGAGALRHLTFSMVSLEIFGLAPNFRRAVESGELELTEMTGCALNTAIDAGARNVPFLPLAPLGSSEVPSRQPGMYAELKDPFTGREVLAIRAIRPDVAIVHMLRADASGNAQSDGPLAIDPELSRAAKRVIVTCEEIVSRAEIEATPHMTKIPGFLVDVVIEAPLGAHPTTHVPRYGFDAWSVRDYAAAAAAPETWAPYLEQIRSESEDDYRSRVVPDERARVLASLAESGKTLEKGIA
jgi:acyl CoA:acetate/3-ketoacid CoA transferase alpha subunit